MMSRRDYCIRRRRKVKKFSQRSENPYYIRILSLRNIFMQSAFLQELLVTLLEDESLQTKRDYQKTKNLLPSKDGNTVEDTTSIEVIAYYRMMLDEKILHYSPRVWKILRKR
jgi:hypothetical protein